MNVEDEMEDIARDCMMRIASAAEDAVHTASLMRDAAEEKTMDTAEMISPYQRSVLQTPMTPVPGQTFQGMVQGGISSSQLQRRVGQLERAIKEVSNKEVTSPTLPRKIRRLSSPNSISSLDQPEI